MFVRATSYQTNAEREGWARVWNVMEKRWEEVEGANWQHPLGPQGDPGYLERHPVVSIDFYAARAYCAWLNRQACVDLPGGYHFRLPGEAEWEKVGVGEPLVVVSS